MQVLFVCSGNTCRSPLAEAALRMELGADAARVTVGSLGTSALDGAPATPLAIEVAAESGADLGAHRSRRATRDRLAGADVVLAMEASHLRALERLGADPARCHLLSEWPSPGEPELELSDPYGGSKEAYEECWRRIRKHVQRAGPSIVEALRSRSL